MENYPYFKTIQRDVPVSGTPVQLPDISVGRDSRVLLKAKASNSDDITFGPSASEANHNNSDHFTLPPGSAVDLNLINVNKIYIDAKTSGDGVELVCERDTLN